MSDSVPVPKKPIRKFAKVKDLAPDLFKIRYDRNKATAEQEMNNIAAHLGENVTLDLSVEEDDDEVRFYINATINF